jgi:hypothetical protein
VNVDTSPIRKIKESGPVYNPNRESSRQVQDQLEEEEISGHELKVVKYKNKTKEKMANESGIPE